MTASNCEGPNRLKPECEQAEHAVPTTWDDRFYSLVFLIRGTGENIEEWFSAPANYTGVRKVIEDIHQEVGFVPPLVLGVDHVPNTPERCAWLKERYDGGDEIAVQEANLREPVAAAVGIPVETIITKIADWGAEEEPWKVVDDYKAGIRVRFVAVLEGDSHIGETIDCGHNWEGRPFFPYWVQTNFADPKDSAMTNRQLEGDETPLELMWLTRTPWSLYDRFCFQYSFHVGDVRVGGKPWRCDPDDIWYWRNEVDNYERNLKAGYLKIMHLSITNEAHQFMEEENRRLLVDLVKLLDGRGWKCRTGKGMLNCFTQRWHAPDVPSQIMLFDDTARNPQGKYEIPPWFFEPKETVDQGHLLVAETKHFRITEHEHRLSPYTEVAYDMEAPNLYVHGCAGKDIRRPEERTELHDSRTFTDGTGAVDAPDQLAVTASSGNILFWGPESARGLKAKWEHFAEQQGLPPLAKQRCYTVKIGDHDLQFPAKQRSKRYGRIFGVRRDNYDLYWEKEVHAEFQGRPFHLRMQHHLAGRLHHVRVLSADPLPAGTPISLAFRPYFYPGWLLGQDENVFAFVPRGEEFAWSTVNGEYTSKRYRAENLSLTGEQGCFAVHCRVQNHTPLHRGVAVLFPQHPDLSLVVTDYPGPAQLVEAELVFPHGIYDAETIGQFSLYYFRGEPEPALDQLRQAGYR